MPTITENMLNISLGAINLTREKARLMVNDLVARGEVEKKEASALVDRLMEKGKAQREEMSKILHDELQKVMPASKAMEERLAALDERVKHLEEKVEQGFRPEHNE